MDLLARPGRFYKGNIHTHSTAPDAVRDPAPVRAMFRDMRHDFLALTDRFQAHFGFPIPTRAALPTLWTVLPA